MQKYENRLSVPRGSERSFTVALNYELQSGDVLYFGVKKRETDEDLMISKSATSEDADENGHYVFTIGSDDTTNLESGEYLYDIGLQFSNGKFQQVVPVSIFVVDTAITQRSDEE